MKPTETNLLELVKNIEALEEERNNISSELKTVYDKAKVDGFDVKVLRQIIHLRKLEPKERNEQQSLLNAYMTALGMKQEDK